MDEQTESHEDRQTDGHTDRQQRKTTVLKRSVCVSVCVIGDQGPVYRAMYDYEAQDDDEVSFVEDDIVVNVQPVDDGWVLGVVQRTNQRGMIPSNYIQPM